MITYTIKIEEVNGVVQISAESPKSIATGQEAMFGNAVTAFVKGLIQITGGETQVEEGGYTPFGNG